MATQRKIATISPRVVLTVLLITTTLPWGGACSLLKRDNGNGNANSNSSANSNNAGTTSQAQPEVLEPVAGRLSQITGEVAISHQYDPGSSVTPASAAAGTPIGQPGGGNPSAGTAPPAGQSGAPAARPSVYSKPAAGPPTGAAPLDAQGSGGASAVPALDQSGQGDAGWTQASNNMPLAVGDRLYVPDGGKVGLGLGGRKYVRFDPGSTLEVVSLSKNHTQLAFRSGTAVFDIGEIQPNELFEVDTPCGAVDFTKPGLYQIGFNTDGSGVLTVLNGQAQVLAMGGAQTVTRGQSITLPLEGEGQIATVQPQVSDVAPTVCGGIVNDYYGFRYGSKYDGRYADYNTYLSDPYYYDPYQRCATHQYISDDDYIAGLDDLDGAGDWEPGDEYGQVWYPHVEAGWVPYRSGYWVSDGTLGLSWCATESWGWAPYHYGRWAYIHDRWGWVPTVAISAPIYSPALVAWSSYGTIGAVGWFPLGPGDPWVPCYYGPGYNPYYVGVGVEVTSFHNYLIAGAVTAVAFGAFGRLITPGVCVHVDATVLATGRPFFNPYRDESIRRASFGVGADRPRAFVPAGVRQGFGRPVVSGTKPELPRAVAARSEGLHVQQVPEGARNRAMAVNKGGLISGRGSNGLPGAGAVAGAAALGAAGGAAAMKLHQNQVEKQQEKQQKLQQQQQLKQQKLQEQQQKQQQKQQFKQQQQQQQQQKQQQKQQFKQQQQQQQQQKQQQKQQFKQQQQQQQQQKQQQFKQQQQQQQQQQKQFKQQQQQQQQQQKQQQFKQQQQQQQQKQQQFKQQQQQQQQKQQQFKQQQQQQKQFKQQQQQQKQKPPQMGGGGGFPKGGGGGFPKGGGGPKKH